MASTKLKMILTGLLLLFWGIGRNIYFYRYGTIKNEIGPL